MSELIRYGAAVPLAEIITVLLVVVSGLFMTVLGGFTATNYKGFADRHLMDAVVSVRWLRRIPPWSMFPPRPGRLWRLWHRAMAGIFALLGPFMVILGVHAALSGSLGRSDDLPAAPRYQLDPSNILFGIGCLIAWSLILPRIPSIGVMRQSQRRSARVLRTCGYVAMVLYAAGIALAAPLLFLPGLLVLTSAVIVYIVAGHWHPGDSTEPEVISKDPLYGADVAWPDRRADVVAALATLTRAHPDADDGGAEPRSRAVDVAIRRLVDDTGWDYRHPVAEIGTILQDEREAEALCALVGAIVTVRARPTEAGRSGGDGWSDVRSSAADALEAMRF